MLADPRICRRYHAPRVSGSAASTELSDTYSTPSGKWPQKIIRNAHTLRTTLAAALPASTNGRLGRAPDRLAHREPVPDPAARQETQQARAEDDRDAYARGQVYHRLHERVGRPGHLDRLPGPQVGHRPEKGAEHEQESDDPEKTGAVEEQDLSQKEHEPDREHDHRLVPRQPRDVAAKEYDREEGNADGDEPAKTLRLEPDEKREDAEPEHGGRQVVEEHRQRLGPCRLEARGLELAGAEAPCKQVVEVPGLPCAEERLGWRPDGVHRLRRREGQQGPLLLDRLSVDLDLLAVD